MDSYLRWAAKNLKCRYVISHNMDLQTSIVYNLVSMHNTHVYDAYMLMKLFFLLFPWYSSQNLEESPLKLCVEGGNDCILLLFLHLAPPFFFELESEPQHSDLHVFPSEVLSRWVSLMTMCDFGNFGATVPLLRPTSHIRFQFSCSINQRKTFSCNLLWK